MNTRDNLPERIQKYRLKDVIGSGGMAVVYLAEDTVLHRDVAIKMIHPHLLGNKETVQRLNTEACAIASLNHENIIRLFDFGEENGRQFLVMEYVDGKALDSILEHCRTLPNLVLCEIILQVLHGLGAAHEKGIYHRDIKPANVIIDRLGCVKITDFGIAYLVNKESMTMTGTFVGSPSHISPEQASGVSVTDKSDVFSLGIMAYAAATGHIPFDGDNPLVIINAIIKERPTPAWEVRGAVLRWLSDCIDKCLAKEPYKRPSLVDAISLIEQKCREDGITPGRQRISRFMAEQENYRRSEESELFAVYRKKARIYYKKGKLAEALRCLGQAKSFGTLPGADEKLFRRVSLLRCVGVAVGIIFLVIGIVFTFYFVGELLNRRSEEIPVTDGSVVYEESAVVDLNTDTIIRYSGNMRQPDTDPSDDTIVSSFPVSVPVTIKEAGLVQPEKATAVVGQKVTHGFLKISTNPPWVVVCVDDVERGETPRIRLIPLTAGEHRLLLRKQGFKEIIESFEITTRDTLEKRVKLIKVENE